MLNDYALLLPPYFTSDLSGPSHLPAVSSVAASVRSGRHRSTFGNADGRTTPTRGSHGPIDTLELNKSGTVRDAKVISPAASGNVSAAINFDQLSHAGPRFVCGGLMVGETSPLRWVPIFGRLTTQNPPLLANGRHATLPQSTIRLFPLARGGLQA